MNRIPVTVLLLAACALVAPAQGPRGGGRRMGPPPSRLIDALDADRDGVISATEWGQAPASLKAALDANRNGAIEGEEMRPPEMRGGPGGPPPQQQQQPGVLQSLLALDANRDGALDKTEVPERMQGIFARGDKNNDGRLTRAELETMTAASEQRNPARDGGPPDPVRNALDADRDGVISAAELQAAPAALAKLDRNSDGQLAGDEIRPPMRGGRGGNPEEMYKHILEENDANKDGKLAVSELPERMREFLGRADTDRDGFLSLDEMKAMRGPGGREH
ncbi:MAG: hypothetical protein IT162_21465 [Bryobacterales bacterium]|nr:hypothetical protein [Bryobacterales bacterium]